MRRPSLCPLAAMVAWSLLAAGCGAGDLPASDDLQGAVDAGADLAPPPVDFSLPGRPPTDHPPLPLMEKHKGPVLKAMEIWTVVWPGNEALGARVNAFHDWMLKSAYWSESLSEYGVGPGVAKGVVVLPQAAPPVLSVSAFGGLVASLESQPKYAPNANTAFAFVVPLTTQVTGGAGREGCFNYGGYHTETANGTVYEVNLQCAGQGNGAFDDLTYVLSHEAAEAATDPHPRKNPGWYDDELELSGEVSDLCIGLSEIYPTNVQGPSGAESYYVTRNWSNKAAKAGNVDPCVPAPKDLPYFNVAVDPLVIPVVLDGQGKGTTKARLLPYAFGDVGTISWQVGRTAPGVEVSPMKGNARAGDTIPMVVTATPDAEFGAFIFSLAVQAQKGGRNQWFGAISIE
ncbi:MAG: hypothetical protein EXR72_09820 [Myxococcales bacterium]|nr:hypothetical protein [Myxococcales bacterium]